MMLIVIWVLLSLFLLTYVVAVYAQSDGTGEADKLVSSAKNTTANATDEVVDSQSVAKSKATGTSIGEKKENTNKIANDTLQLKNSQYFLVEKNGKLTIDESAVIKNPKNLTFTFIVKMNASHGTVNITGPKLIYTPNTDYIGFDNFTFIASAINTTKPIESNQQKVTVAVGSTLKLEESRYLTVEKNGNRTIGKSAVIYNPTSLPFTFIVKKNPSHGTMGISGSKLTYIPYHNFNATDTFSFIASAINTTKPIESNQQIVTIKVEPNPLIKAPPEIRAALAFGLSLIVVFLIFLIAFLVIRETRPIGRKTFKTKFWDIVRDGNWYPSLAIFQFLMWTGIVLFVYFGIALIRFFSGVGPFTDISENILYVMGISAVTTGGATAISRFRYGGSTPVDVEPTKEIPSDEVRSILPGYRTMLMENDKITLTRFQMFAWTWIGIIAYLGLVFLVTSTQLDDAEKISLPTLPTVFIALMGISQAAYLGDKSVKSRYFSINEVRPEKVRLKEGDNKITVLGSNFGDSPGTVWLEYYRPLTEDEKKYNCPELSEKQKMKMGSEAVAAYQRKCKEKFRYDSSHLEGQFDVTPQVPQNPQSGKWENNRIVLSLDNVKDKLKPVKPDTYEDKYVVRVEVRGLLTYAKSDAAFSIIYGPQKPDDKSTPTTTPTTTPTNTY